MITIMKIVGQKPAVVRRTNAVFLNCNGARLKILDEDPSQFRLERKPGCAGLSLLLQGAMIFQHR